MPPSNVLPNDILDSGIDATTARLRLGQAARMQGAFAEAEDLYRSAVADPAHASIAWNNLGAALAAQGRHDEALAAWRRGADLDPADPVNARNLGLALGRAGEPKTGLKALEPALRAHPDDVGISLALMRLLFQIGEHEAAIEQLKRAIERDPGAVRGEFPVSGKLQFRGDDGGVETIDRPQPSQQDLDSLRKAIQLAEAYADADAEEVLKETLQHDPAAQDAYLKLARIYQRSGRDALAEATLRQLLAIAPDHPVARHKLDVLTGVLNEPRVPDGFVSQLFDRFSETFDAVLRTLDYQAPTLALDMLQRYAPIQQPVRVLDLGCGTGLCGLLLRSYANHLTGVDLSPGMLAKARARSVYDELIQSEIGHYLAAEQLRFPIVVASDVLCYFARLEPIFAAIARILDPGGRFVCTLERMDEAESGEDVLLRHHGRYSHREAHVRAALEQAALEVVAIERHRLRNEAGVPVEGLVVLARARRSSAQGALDA